MLFELTFNYDFGQALNKYTYSSKYQWKVKDVITKTYLISIIICSSNTLTI